MPNKFCVDYRTDARARESRVRAELQKEPAKVAVQTIDHRSDVAFRGWATCKLLILANREVLLTYMRLGEGPPSRAKISSCLTVLAMIVTPSEVIEHSDT